MANQAKASKGKAARRKGAKPQSGGALASLVAATAFIAVAVGSIRERGRARPAGAGGGAVAAGSLGPGTPAPPPSPLKLRADRRTVAGDHAAVKEPPAILVKADRWQRRHKPVAFAVGVVRKFGDDRAGYLAALVSYFGFFSVFPLLMALTSVLGMVLEGNEDLRADIQSGAADQIPVIGKELSVGAVTGSVVAVVVGVAVAVWSGLRVIDAIQNALNDVWDVPMIGRPKLVKRRLKSIVMVGVLGLALIGSLAAGSVATLLPDLPGLGRFGVVALTVLFNVGVFVLAFKLLSELDHSWRELLPGAAFAAVAWSLLQTLGASYIQRTIDQAGDTYGTFATVIGLLTFFFLAAQVVIFGAEINVVHARSLWPRSLLAAYGELTPADRQVLADSAEATRRLADQRVQVGFGYPRIEG